MRQAYPSTGGPKSGRAMKTVVLGPKVPDGAAREAVQVSCERPPSMQVTRADLVREVVETLPDDYLVDRAPNEHLTWPS
jgi:hypothetical protein